MRLLATLVILAICPLGALAQDCAEGERLFAHHAGETCIPEAPQRIVTLHDLTLTLPLVELGLTERIVGSMGRLYDGMTSPELGTVNYLTGVDFGNSGIAFVGMWEYDLEAIAALGPDLIIGRPNNIDIHDRLSAIAPTVLPGVDRPFLDYLEEIARLGGAEDAFAAHRARYEARIEGLRAAVEAPGEIDVAILHASPDWVAVYDDFYALSQVMDDLGLSRPEAVEALFAGDTGAYDHATSKDISAEAMLMADADLLILPYWFDEQGRSTPAEVRAGMEAVLPGWCGFFRACAERQVVYLEATEVYSGSFASLDAALDVVEAHVAGRDLVQILE